MATVDLGFNYAMIDNWAGDLLDATQALTITTQTARTLTYTFDAGGIWAGYTVSLTGTGFTYDGTLPIAGNLHSLTITDQIDEQVIQISHIPRFTAAADLGALMAYAIGWTDSDGQTDPNVMNAWSLLLSGDDTINGTDFEDGHSVVGANAGNDVFNMGAGDDWVAGSLGKDTIHGGEGWDALSYTDTSWSGGYATVRGITVLVEAGAVLDPYGDVDSFDSVEEFHGTVTRDTFIGGSTGSDFFGLRGSDTFAGGTSAEDYVIYSDDEVNGGMRGIVARLQVRVDGADTLGTIRDGFGNFDSTSNIANVIGTRFDDRFYGSATDNYFVGGEGVDSYHGGAGFDMINFDWWFGGNDPTGVFVNLRRAGGQIIDDGFGNTENAYGIEDVIGTITSDRIIGNAFGNLIIGNGGDDKLTGGDGTDTFRWCHHHEIGQRMVITDFQGGADAGHDILSFAQSNDGLSTTLNLVIGTAATDAVETFIFDPLTHILSFDYDGTGALEAQRVVRLNGVTLLTADNFDLY